MRRIAFVAFLVFCGLAALPAYADPILPDPFVGVRGGDGSIDSDDFGFHDMNDGNCPVIGTFSVSCLTFDIVHEVSFGTVRSITLAFTEFSATSEETDGFGLPNEFLSLDTSSANLFQGAFVKSEDGFSVTLNFSPPPVPSLSSSAFSTASVVPPGFSCNSYEGPNCRLQIYIYPGLGEEDHSPFEVSLRAINGQTIDTTPIPAPVPEPATLLLMGTGIAGLTARRLRRRSH